MSQLESIITQAWQRKAWWLWLFYPLSLLYGGISRIRHLLHAKGWLHSYHAPVPVMVIGNITLGGSGKTPLIIALVTYLQQKGVNVGVISRGYGGDSTKMPCMVTKDSLPQVVGDEPCLIVGQTGVPMSVCPNRKLAIECLLQAHPKVELIISDDGLQHYALHRDIEWIVVDAERGFGNRQLFPTGYLREPITRLQGSTIIYHHVYHEGDKRAYESKINTHPPLTMTLKPEYIEPLMATQTLEPTQKIPASEFCITYPKVYALSGIGYPTRFFNTLRHIGFEVIERPFADHHPFSQQDFADLDVTHNTHNKQKPKPKSTIPIVITSKDAVKIRHLITQYPDMKKLPIWVLPVSAVLSSECYQLLDKQLHSYQIQI